MLDKRELERYLADKRNDLSRLEIRKRNIILTPSREFIQVIYGPRRAGKSYLLLDMVKEMDPDRVLYLNFDDIQLDGWSAMDVFDSVSIFHEIYGREPDTIVLDEIQRIEGWARAVISPYEKKRYRIFLTGSSSGLLAREIDTSLRGRSLKQVLFPLSFREYLSFRDIEISDHPGTNDIVMIRRALMEYLEKGSFPGIIGEDVLGQRFYDDYVDLVVYRDLVERFGISNLPMLRFLIRNVISSYSKPLSINRLANTWRSLRYEGSKKTMYLYLSYLEDVGFALLLKKYSRSERTSDLSTPKVYLPDSGLASNILGPQIGREMENAVIVEMLRRTSMDPSIKVFYWKENGNEMDLVITKNEEVVDLIQVTNSLTHENMEREIDPFDRFPDGDETTGRTLITWTGEERLPEGVRVVSLWEFLLEI